MATVSTELSFILFVSSFLAVLTFLSGLLPSSLRFMNIFDFTWFGGGIIGVGSLCAVVSGIPCAVGLAVFGIASIYSYIVVQDAILKLLIFTPMIIGLIYVISRLGKGGG
jgi:hypothetical protein